MENAQPSFEKADTEAIVDGKLSKRTPYQRKIEIEELLNNNASMDEDKLRNMNELIELLKEEHNSIKRQVKHSEACSK